ncbi:hypothetical protein QZH41_015333 [Actinostola sp. cb2023]|nr:hypothetical protein QZH41_015333 [Actinostola sp. cb2023]
MEQGTVVSLAPRSPIILALVCSGIIAGKTLQDSGIDDFLILEGQDYIGGRIKQAPFSGYNVEKGANWIQDAKDEETAPIWKLKQAKTMRGIYSDYYDMTIRNETGANVTGMASNKEFLKRCFSTAKTEDRRTDEEKIRRSRHVLDCRYLAGIPTLQHNMR